MDICKHEGCSNPVQNPTVSKKGYKQVYNRCSSCAGNIKRYGLTTPQRDAMLAGQSGECKICSSSIEFQGGRGSIGNLGKHQAVIDHCHTTGQVRGIICGHCNCLLGKAGDSVAVLELAIAYLKENSNV